MNLPISLTFQHCVTAALVELTELKFSVDATFLNDVPSENRVRLPYAAADVLYRVMRLHQTIDEARKLETWAKSQMVSMRLNDAEDAFVRSLPF